LIISIKICWAVSKMLCFAGLTEQMSYQQNSYNWKSFIHTFKAIEFHEFCINSVVTYVELNRLVLINSLYNWISLSLSLSLSLHSLSTLSSLYYTVF
jgi:hypothetical protein